MSTLRHVAVSLVLFAVAIEGLGQLALSRDDVAARIEASGRVGRRFGSMRRAHMVRSAGHGALHGVAAGTLAEDPDLGWVARPGAHDSPWGVQTVDAEGRRVTAPVGWRPARPGRVALLGDSFTFGDEVTDAETWAWLVREDLGVVVDDHGVLGHGLDQTVLRLERDVLAEDPPDVVVVGITAVMEYRTGLDWDAWAKPRFALEGTRLVEVGTPVPTADDLLAWHTRLATPWVARLWWERLADTPPSWRSLAELNDALRDRMVADVAAAGAQLLVVWMAADGDLAQSHGGRAVQEWRRWCEARAVACVDTTPSLTAAQRAGLPMFRVAHWTPEANAVAARVIGPEVAARLPPVP
jgi:hypothetical protein